MRSKNEILGELEHLHSETSNLLQKQLISVNMYLEVLIDIRDLGRAFFDRLIDFIDARD